MIHRLSTAEAQRSPTALHVAATQLAAHVRAQPEPALALLQLLQGSGCGRDGQRALLAASGISGRQLLAFAQARLACGRGMAADHQQSGRGKEYRRPAAVAPPAARARSAPPPPTVSAVCSPAALPSSHPLLLAAPSLAVLTRLASLCCCLCAGQPGPASAAAGPDVQSPPQSSHPACLAGAAATCPLHPAAWPRWPAPSSVTAAAAGCRHGSRPSGVRSLPAAAAWGSAGALGKQREQC